MSGFINTITNEWPLYEGDLLALYGTKDLKELDFIKPIIYADRPEVIKGQTMEPAAPELTNGEYIVNWLVRDKTKTELELEAEMMKKLIGAPKVL
jgi:hypothetical protein